MLEVYKKKFVDHVNQLQDQITQQMESLDASLELTEDLYTRKDHIGADGGGGRTRALSGELFENSGVNTSNVFGKISPDFGAKLGGDNYEMWAAGISLIIHPFNPKVPTVHANFRMICSGTKFWFGGGADLTPFYPHEEDFKLFHDVWKKACEPYGDYKEMKKTCDEYFVNTHRDNEMRGIGGIFFDHMNSGDLEADFNKVVDISNHFIESYFPIVETRMNENFTKEDVDFQLHRRGRYVEFNLLHDRGTHFGLKTNGRTDSILISLPARCKYTYKYEPKEKAHQKMMGFYFPKDW
jgi:coproporphyrinogen III oxidase